MFRLKNFVIKLKGNFGAKCRVIAFSTIGLRNCLSKTSTPLIFDLILQYDFIKFSRAEFDELKELYFQTFKLPKKVLKTVWTDKIWDRLFTMLDGHPGLSTSSFNYLIDELPSMFSHEIHTKLVCTK